MGKRVPGKALAALRGTVEAILPEMASSVRAGRIPILSTLPAEIENCQMEIEN
jgi:hypothetical protein